MMVRLADVSLLDVELIEQWLGQEYVACRWGKVSRDELIGTDNHAIIVTDGNKVGYIRWQHPTREELDIAGLEDISTDVMDIDIFIGIESELGKGIGAKAVNLLQAMVMKDEPKLPMFIAGTSIDNKSSIRMFEKAGFRKDREFDDYPSGRYALMVFENSTKSE